MITKEITDPEIKAEITGKILRLLPEWFGNEQSILDYQRDVRNLPFWATFDEDENCVGFLSVKIHFQKTGDIFVCGVDPKFHKQGIGKKLYALAEEYFRAQKCEYAVVKTLSEEAQYEPYEKTRLFYKSLGFEPLIGLTEMWDKENPCLIMIKKL